MPIIQHNSGELLSLVNFGLINQFSLTDYLTFNSGTAGSKTPNLEDGLCSTLLFLVSVVTYALTQSF